MRLRGLSAGNYAVMVLSAAPRVASYSGVDFLVPGARLKAAAVYGDRRGEARRSRRFITDASLFMTATKIALFFFK